jgi:hypothetical protein
MSAPIKNYEDWKSRRPVVAAIIFSGRIYSLRPRTGLLRSCQFPINS